MKKGTAYADTFVVDTSDTVVKIEGHVDLKNERMEFTTYPEPKDHSLFALRSPIVVSGTFMKPKVAPKPGPLVTRGIIAAALAAVAPPLVLLATFETGPGKDTDCGALLADARTKGAVEKKS